MDEKMKNKKGQIAIWVIIAVVLVASILLFFMIKTPGKINPPPASPSLDPGMFIKSCTERYVNESLGIILPQGGLKVPKNYKIFDNRPVEYICFTTSYYEPCLVQHPTIISEMTSEVKAYLMEKLPTCFEELQFEVENRNGKVQFDPDFDVDVNLGKDKVFVTVNKKMTIEKLDEVRSYETFDAVINHPAYNLGDIALQIAEQESTYCYFEYAGYMLTYPRYKIEPYMMSDPTAIYTITDIKTNIYMRVAVRSCAIPSGM